MPFAKSCKEQFDPPPYGCAAIRAAASVGTCSLNWCKVPDETPHANGTMIVRNAFDAGSQTEKAIGKRKYWAEGKKQETV